MCIGSKFLVFVVLEVQVVLQEQDQVVVDFCDEEIRCCCVVVGCSFMLLIGVQGDIFVVNISGKMLFGQ